MENFAGEMAKLKFFLRSSADKKRLVQKTEEPKGNVPESFVGTIKERKKKQRTGLKDFVGFYANADEKQLALKKKESGQDDEYNHDDDHNETDGELDPEDEKPTSAAEEKVAVTDFEEVEGRSSRLSILISQEIFIPRIFTTRDKESVPTNVLVQKHNPAAPPPEEFVEFSITDTIVKVQGKDNGPLGRV